MIDYELFLEGVEEERQRTLDFLKFGTCPDCKQNPATNDGLCNICAHQKKQCEEQARQETSEAENDKLD